MINTYLSFSVFYHNYNNDYQLLQYNYYLADNYSDLLERNRCIMIIIIIDIIITNSMIIIARKK